MPSDCLHWCLRQDNSILVGGLQTSPIWHEDLGNPNAVQIGVLNASGSISGLIIRPLIQYIDGEFSRKWGIRCEPNPGNSIDLPKSTAIQSFWARWLELWLACLGAMDLDQSSVQPYFARALMSSFHSRASYHRSWPRIFSNDFARHCARALTPPKLLCGSTFMGESHHRCRLPLTLGLLLHSWSSNKFLGQFRLYLPR